MGIKRGTTENDWTDGVVAWKSAHCGDAVSEKIIRASHSEVHRHPEAVAEVRRILIEHLRETQRRRYPVVPIRQSVESTSATGIVEPSLVP